MPPSAIHMDHVSRQTQQRHAVSLERPAGEEKSKAQAAGGDNDKGMSFWDVLDVINPLQHIPGVNKVYQAITGDTIKTPAKIAGAALFFGPVGLALAGADAVLEKETGKDAMGHVAHTLGLDGDETPTAPGEDDPFTVTAPRPAKTAESMATPAPAQNAPAAIPELSGAQAAMLEGLMARNTSAAAQAPAAGGIATAQQLKELESTPGASAALMAARGLGSQAALASLPAPGGAGAGDNVLAAMSQEQARPKGATTGRGLAEYRAAALSQGGQQIKPLVPSIANQKAAQSATVMPSSNTGRNPVLTTRIATAPAPTTIPAATTAPAPVAADNTQPATGVTPLPRELIADMMAQAMSKYEAQSRQNPANGNRERDTRAVAR